MSLHFRNNYIFAYASDSEISYIIDIIVIETEWSYSKLAPVVTTAEERPVRHVQMKAINDYDSTIGNGKKEAAEGIQEQLTLQTRAGKGQIRNVVLTPGKKRYVTLGKKFKSFDCGCDHESILNLHFVVEL